MKILSNYANSQIPIDPNVRRTIPQMTNSEVKKKKHSNREKTKVIKMLSKNIKLINLP